MSSLPVLFFIISIAISFAELPKPHSSVSGEKTEARVIEPISNLTELFGNQTSETNITELHKIANSSIVGNESLSFNVSISDELGNDAEKLLPLQANYTVFFNGTTVNGSELHLNGSINVGNESINSNQSVSLIISAKENSQANATGNVTEFSSKKKDTKEEFVSEPRRSYDEAPLSLVEILRNISDFIHNKSMSDLMKQRYKLKHQPDGRGCKEEHLLPCSFGIGRDCNLLLKPNGCFVCTCPYKSPARGCLGPSEVSSHRIDKLLRKNITCENGAFAQHADRYVRNVDINQKDDCVLTIQPYCGFINDVNTYRMPRTKEECYYNCFSDQELHDRDIKLNYKH